ncbi:nuclear transport factor 2 family protein [Leptospira sp. 201903070]|uniref:Nuclear transport factor 2 family protein n=1 Tax=Leptospira ainlahdjerensis TaxID=2810033 RepID=A0ABS2UHZ9_9LEPT|nr:nuclear transport factor 2 family protein [Leptospira ainlahdjerensis]MBM9579469.1 nuclear transport factor 2 family protein [Leptospira ainlahdjerensis]
MKLINFLATFFMTTALFSNNEEASLRTLIQEFVKAGDERNVNKLENVLHKDFRLYAFVGNASQPWEMNREGYLGALKEGKIGGKSRTLSVTSLKNEGNLAYATLIMKSSEMSFVVNQQWIKTESGWRLLQDLANAQVLKK